MSIQNVPLKEFATTLRSSSERYAVVLGNGFTLDLLGRDADYHPLSKEKREGFGKEKSWRNMLSTVIDNFVAGGGKLCFDKKELIDNKDLTDTECGMFIKKFCYKDNENDFSAAIQTAIESMYQRSWPKRAVCGLLDYAWKHKYHILTTNFDQNIETYFKTIKRYSGLKWQSIKRIRAYQEKSSSRNKTAGQTRQTLDYWGMRKKYEWGRFIGEDSQVTMAQELHHDIWHIHGCINTDENLFKDQRRKNVLVTFVDYANAISYARKLGDIQRNDTPASRTWLNIFFNCPLLIAGLHLSSQETFLRRLLVARRNYLEAKNLKLSQSYYLDSNEFKQGTESQEESLNFLHFIGIEGVCFPSFPALYDFTALKNR